MVIIELQLSHVDNVLILLDLLEIKLLVLQHYLDKLMLKLVLWLVLLIQLQLMLKLQV